MNRYGAVQCGADDPPALAAKGAHARGAGGLRHSPCRRIVGDTSDRRVVGATFSRRFVGTTFSRWLIGALLLAFFSATGCAAEPGPMPPDRRELWVPTEKVARILGKKAVLLTRDQYETLLRDAAGPKAPKPVAPAAAALSNATFRAVPNGRTLQIHAELIVNVLRDGWAEMPLEFPGAVVGEVKMEGEAVLMPAVPAPAKGKAQAPARLPAVLVIRGRGEHRITLELTTPIRDAAGVSSFEFSVPGVASGTFSLVLPVGATVEQMPQAAKITADARVTTAAIALLPSAQHLALSWKGAISAVAARVPIQAQAQVRYQIDAEKVAGGFRFAIESLLGDLPEMFEFSLTPGVKVLAVRADELRGWEADDGKLVARLQPGARKKVEIELHIEFPALAGKDSAALALTVPSLKGVPRIEGTVFVAADDDVLVKDIPPDPTLRRTPTVEDKGERGFFAAYTFSDGAKGLKVSVERARPRVEADIDTLVEFRSDAVRLSRTVTLHEQKGRRFSMTITLPAGEELLDVRRIEDAGAECEPEWTQEGGVVLIKWSDESAKPRVFRLRTRVEPERWTELPPKGTTFTLGDAKIADAAKVTGYIALVAEPAFRLEAQPGETLERRDGRATPVRGDYAWFRRDTFELKVKIVRRPAEVLAALTGYALPLEGLLDLHASMNYQFLGGGTRTVRLRVPKEFAPDFHFEGASIAERALVDDVWTITFQKELTGAYALAISAQVPIVRKAGDGDAAKGWSFAARVPVISPLDVVRASGLWAIEANTETEIHFDAAGMNELDSLLAPQIPGYTPRHRVIGVFGWLGADYALTLNGVRHAAAGMLTAVVDRLELNTVISTSGRHLHEAIYHLRAAGVEYLDVALPRGAGLLSVAIDGVAVKPVASEPGTVRLPLPAKRDTDAQVAATFVYETQGGAWESRGTLALNAPSIAGDIPVLKSKWRVWVPEGFSFSDIESNLPVPESLPEPLLVETLAPMAVGVITAPYFLFEFVARDVGEHSASMGASSRGFTSTAQMMVSGQVRMGASAAAYSEELVNFFGTQIHVMLSAEVRKRAEMRMRSLHPDLEPEDVKLEAERIRNSQIFQLRATGSSPAYTQAFLNACMNEYLAMKKEMRSQKQEGAQVSVQDELVRLEKAMLKEEEEMHTFQKGNNIAALREEGNSAGTYLGELSRQLADAKTEFDVLKPRENSPADKARSESLRRQIASLEGTIKEWDAKALSLARRVAEFDRIKSKIERTQQQHDRLLTSLRGMDVSRNLEQDTVSILAMASGPPSSSTAAASGRKEAKANLDQPKRDEKPGAETPGKQATAAISRKLDAIIFPKIDFRDSNVSDVVEYLMVKSKEFDPEHQGVNIVFSGEARDWGKTPITLTLTQVPLIEVIRYVTNLANMKFKIEASRVVIVPIGIQTEELFTREWKIAPKFFLAAPEGASAGNPATPGGKDFLAAQGVMFGPGANAFYSRASNTLVVKNSQEQLDLIDRMVESLSEDPGGRAASASGIGRAGHLSRAGMAADSQLGKTAGLLPVKLDLPKTGPVLVFDGLYAPERIVMRYDDWWSRARHLWMWFVGGGIAFYVFAGRRPWWLTLWALLLLSAIPLCVSAAWTPVCNALLGGWLVGLVLNRIAVRCVFRARKEVLA